MVSRQSQVLSSQWYNWIEGNSGWRLFVYAVWDCATFSQFRGQLVKPLQSSLLTRPVSHRHRSGEGAFEGQKIDRETILIV